MPKICLIGDMIFDKYLYPYKLQTNQEIVFERTPKYYFNTEGIIYLPGGAGNVYDILSKVVDVDFVTCNHFDYFDSTCVYNMLEDDHQKTEKIRLVVNENVALRLDFDATDCSDPDLFVVRPEFWEEIDLRVYDIFTITHYNKSISYDLIHYLLYEISHITKPIVLIVSLKPPVYDTFFRDLDSFISQNSNIQLFVVQNLKEFRAMSQQLKDKITERGFLISTSADRVTLHAPGKHKIVCDVQEKDYATTNGAGDAFLAYFTHGLSLNLTIKEAIDYAINTTYRYLDVYNKKNVG